MIITRFARGAATCLILLAVIAAGCSSEVSPTTPTATAMSTGTGTTLGLTGRWAGLATDSSGAGTMVWTLTESGNTFGGAVTVVDATAGITGNGTLTGTVSGATSSFSLSVPAGGFSGPYAGCSSTVRGEATLSGSTLTATYAGSNSCSGGITGGTATLTRE